MSMNREQGLFLVVLLAAGGWIALRHTDRYEPRPLPRAARFEVAAAAPAPVIEFAADDEPRFRPEGRDFFQPPRDWNPLPPLVLAPPPLPEIGAVGLVPEPPVEPEHLHLYRRPPPRETASAPAAVADDASNGTNGNAGAFGGIDFSAAAETPAQEGPPVADEATLARTYDWIKRKSLKRIWGHVRNPDKFRLLDDPGLPIRFQQVNVETGKPLAIADFERGDLEGDGVFQQGFGFAESVANRIVLLKRAAGKSVGSQIDAARQALEWVDEDAGAALAGAEEFLRSVLAYDPTQAEAWELLARTKEAAFDTEGELRVYDDARAANVRTSRLETRRGRLLYRRLGLVQRAEDVLRQAVKDNPSDHRAHLELGRFLIAQDRAQDALKPLETAESTASTQEERLAARLELAEAAICGAELEQATQKVEQVMRMGRETARAHVLKGVLDLLQHEPTRAVGSFQRALEVDPRAREAVFDLGIALAVQAGDATAAQQAHARFEQSADLDPLTLADAAIAHGALEEALGNVERAAWWFEEALGFDPGDPFGLYRSGRIARRRGDMETARRHLRRSLEEDGRINDVLNELGYTELLDDEPVRAELYLRESVRREPGHRDIHVLLGSALLRQNQVRGARDAFVAGRGDAAAPNAAALCGIAWCDYRLDDVDAALQALAEARASAVEGDSFHVYADQNQARIEDHRNKEQWVDTFDRRQIRNNWEVREPYGPQFQATGDVLELKGMQRRSDPDLPTELMRQIEGPTFVSLEAVLAVDALNEGIAGIRYVHTRLSGREAVPYGEIGVARFPDGTLRLYVRDDNRTVSQDWVPLAESVPAGTSFRLTIEQTDAEKGQFRVLLDGRVVADGIESRSLRKLRHAADGGVFARAAGAKNVALRVLEVRVVRYRS